MFTYGFYNSMKGDRKYDAVQMSSIFDGIIEDGIFANVGEQFTVIPGTGMQVIVKTGRAWFKHTWNLNDSWMTLTVPAADTLRPRIDSVVLEINSNTDVRENSIKIVSGTPATPASAPEMVHADGVDQYRLADITVPSGATSIVADNIAIKVGQGETPFVTAPLKSVDISDLFNQWNAQWENKLDEWSDEFYEWFDNLKQQLTDDVVTNLQKQIDERVKIADKATAEDIAAGTPGKWVDAEAIQKDVYGIVNGLKIGDIVYSSRDLEAETNGAMIACDQRKISRLNYPDLWSIDSIQRRIPNLTDGVLQSLTGMTYYKSPNIINIHNGYIYLPIRESTTMHINRCSITADTPLVSEFVCDVHGLVTTTNFWWYAEDDTMYIIEVDQKGRVYKVNLVDGTYTTIDIINNTYIDAAAYTRLSTGEHAFIQYPKDIGVAIIKEYVYNVAVYSPDFLSRTEKTINLNISSSNNVRSVSIPSDSGSLTNSVTRTSYNVYEDDAVFGALLGFSTTTGTETVSSNNYVRLFFINFNNGTSTKRDYTLSELGLDNIIGSSVSSGSSTNLSFLIIINNDYIYLFTSTTNGSGTWINTIIDKNTKEVLNKTSVASGAFTSKMFNGIYVDYSREYIQTITDESNTFTTNNSIKTASEIHLTKYKLDSKLTLMSEYKYPNQDFCLSSNSYNNIYYSTVTPYYNNVPFLGMPISTRAPLRAPRYKINPSSATTDTIYDKSYYESELPPTSILTDNSNRIIIGPDIHDRLIDIYSTEDTYADTPAFDNIYGIKKEGDCIVFYLAGTNNILILDNNIRIAPYIPFAYIKAKELPSA